MIMEVIRKKWQIYCEFETKLKKRSSSKSGRVLVGKKPSVKNPVGWSL
jgi:hypothetical protein